MNILYAMLEWLGVRSIRVFMCFYIPSQLLIQYSHQWNNGSYYNTLTIYLYQKYRIYNPLLCTITSTSWTS